MKRNPHTASHNRNLAAVRGVAALGDAIAFVLFAAAGEGAHRDAGGLASTVKVAAPFAAGWFAAALPLGAFRAQAFRSHRFSLLSVARSWVAGCALAMTIRSAVEGHVMPPAFVAIAFAFNVVVLNLWRAFLVTATGAVLKGGRRLPIRRSRAPTR